MTHPIRVSASRLKLATECTLKFYYGEVLRLPDEGHHKARQGDCVHLIFELFMAPKRLARLKDVVLNGFNPTVYPSIERFIRFYDAKYQIAPYEMAAMLDMVRVAFLGIRPYFIDMNGEFSPPVAYHNEYEFKIQVGEATLKGFIDLLLVWPDRAVVLDLKSQKEKFSRADVPNNVQAAIYQLATYRQLGLIPVVEFILLRHPPSKRYPNMHIQRVEPPQVGALTGLEVYVETIYKRFNQFSLEDAYTHPHKDQGFCRNVCRYLKPFPYWVVCAPNDPTGLNPLSSHLSLDKAQKVYITGQHILERRHPGCALRYKPDA